MGYQNYPPPGHGSTYPPPLPQVYPPPPQPDQLSGPPQYTGHPYPQPYPDPSGGYSYPPPRPPYQGYFGQNYPPPQPQPQPQAYHCDHDDYDNQNDCASFLKGWMAALCFCCVLEEFCGLA